MIQDTLLFQRIDSVPLRNDENLSLEFQRWLSALVDSLNTMIEEIERYVLPVTTLTDATQAADIDTTYIPTNSSQTVITLPSVARVGSRVKIVGLGAGGWSLNPSAGQTIEVAASTATVSVQSAERYDSIEVMCVTADTTWVTTSDSTTGFIIT